MSLKRIGVLGSAFDPPTLGHQDVILQAQTVCDEIILLPAICHPFKPVMTEFETRCHWVDALIKDTRKIHSIPLSLSRMEQALWSCDSSQPVFTYTVLEALEKKLYPKTKYQLIFIRGEDNAALETWSKFYKAEAILDRWSVFTAQVRIDIRSSQVKALIDPNPTHLIKEQLKALMSPSVFNLFLQALNYSES